MTDRILCFGAKIGNDWSLIGQAGHIEYVLKADVWSADEQPTYTINGLYNIKENSIINIVPSVGITKDEFDALQSADLQDGGQSKSSITLKLYGIKPVIDIPITIIIKEVATKEPLIFGVKKTGQTTDSGWSLDWCDINGDTIDLAASDFKQHGAYNSNGYGSGFADYSDELGNTFCTIPIAYWWRGYIDGVWTMLISDVEGTFKGKTFAPHKAVFKRYTEMLDNIYVGKYRGYYDPDNNVIKSVSANKNGTGNIILSDYKTYCTNNGEHYYSLSIQDQQEIALREVIEKKTFNTHPSTTQTDAASSVYRGIERWCYVGDTALEWFDGISVDHTNNKLSLMSDDGNRIMYDTTLVVPSGYPNSLLSNSLTSFLILPASTSNRASAVVPNIANFNENYLNVNTYDSKYGAFAVNTYNYNSLYKNALLAGRLVKK